MKKILIIIFTLLALTGVAQEKSVTDNYNNVTWDCTVIFLPTVTGANEIYSLTPNKFKHKYSEDKRKWRINYRKRKHFRTGDRESILNGLDYLSKNICNKAYLVDFKLLDKDKFYDKIHKNNYLNINDSILNEYFDKDTLLIQFDEFETEYSSIMDALSGVIDGAVFTISLEIVKNTDTIHDSYRGNIYDGVEDTQVRDFLLYYDLKNKYKIFANHWLSEYLSDDNFYNVILRYIAYKEGTIKRNLTDEDKDNYNSQIEHQREIFDRLKITQHNTRYIKLGECR